jgi:hypothetical protein
MARIFAPQVGKVAVIREDYASPAIIRVAGFSPVKGAITGIGYSAKVLAQFMMTLRNHIFVYTIGDDMGDLNISGIAFSSVCGKSGAHGISEVFSMYESNKLSVNSRPVIVTIGNHSISGMLTNLTVNGRVELTGMMEYQMALKTIPDELNTRYLEWFEESEVTPEPVAEEPSLTITASAPASAS